MKADTPKSIVPVKARTHPSAARASGRWIPTFAGLISHNRNIRLAFVTLGG
jgi:hypothetical protein